MEQLYDNIEVNEDTGEITSNDIQIAVTVDDLPRLARKIAAIERQIATVDTYMHDEIARITAHCVGKLDTLNSQRTYLMTFAEHFHKQLGGKRLDYPGLGSFSVRKGRQSVDTTLYDEASDEIKHQMAETSPDLFRKTVKIAPDKKGIKERLTSGDTTLYNPQNNTELGGYFTLQTSEPTFVFKRED